MELKVSKIKKNINLIIWFAILNTYSGLTKT